MICVGMVGQLRCDVLENRLVNYRVDPMRCAAELWTALDRECMKVSVNGERFRPNVEG